jgi:hypothetical protein
LKPLELIVEYPFDIYVYNFFVTWRNKLPEALGLKMEVYDIDTFV